MYNSVCNAEFGLQQRNKVDTYLLTYVVSCILQKGKKKPSEMGEAYYLIGVCHLEQCNFLLALDAFSNAIKTNPKHAEVHELHICQSSIII